MRGQAVVVAGQLVPVQAGPLAVLRALAAQPGRVLSAAEIRAVMPDARPQWTITRSRWPSPACVAALGGTDLDGAVLVQTVMKRGYRLAV